MRKTKIIGFIDTLFICFSIFLLIYAWINFFIRNLLATFILSLIFTFALTFLLFFFLDKRRNKKEKLKDYLKSVDKNFLAFRLMSLSEQIALINKIVSTKHNTKIINNSILFKESEKTSKILFATSIETLSDFDLINLLQGVKNINQIVIICNKVQPDLNSNLLKDVSIEFVDKTKLYNDYFFANSIYPNTEILNSKVERKKIKEIVKNFFIPQKAKSYFLCGLILIFSSIILPYHYYYLIFGSCLLIASIFCKIRPLFHR